MPAITKAEQENIVQVWKGYKADQTNEQLRNVLIEKYLPLVQRNGQVAKELVARTRYSSRCPPRNGDATPKTKVLLSYAHGDGGEPYNSRTSFVARLLRDLTVRTSKEIDEHLRGFCVVDHSVSPDHDGRELHLPYLRNRWPQSIQPVWSIR